MWVNMSMFLRFIFMNIMKSFQLYQGKNVQNGKKNVQNGKKNVPSGKSLLKSGCTFAPNLVCVLFLIFRSCARHESGYFTMKNIRYFFKVMFAAVLCGAIIVSCGGRGGSSSGNGANDDIESAEMPEMDETVEGFEKFMKQFVPKAEKMAKLKGDQAALMNEMAFVMDFQEYTRTLTQWIYWIEQNRHKFSAEEEARVDKAMEPLQ